MKTKRKWFYPLQDIADKRFEEMYPNQYSDLVYQIVTKDRVVEHWRFGSPGGVHELLVLMVRHGSDSNASLLMYEMNFVASN